MSFRRRWACLSPKGKKKRKGRLSDDSDTILDGEESRGVDLQGLTLKFGTQWSDLLCYRFPAFEASRVMGTHDKNEGRRDGFACSRGAERDGNSL